MVITLSAELTAKVEQGMAHGGYESADAYVADAIEAMHEHEERYLLAYELSTDPLLIVRVINRARDVPQLLGKYKN